MVAVVLPNPNPRLRSSRPVDAPARGGSCRTGSGDAVRPGRSRADLRRSGPAQARSRRPGPQRHLWAILSTAVAGAAVLALAALPALDLSTSRVSGTYVVTEGDTIWSIASEMAPAGGAAGYAERLVEMNGSSVVAAGQVLELPAR